MRKEIVVGFSFLLISCTVGPDYHKPELYSDTDLQQSIGIKNNSTQITFMLTNPKS